MREEPITGGRSQCRHIAKAGSDPVGILRHNSILEPETGYELELCVLCVAEIHIVTEHLKDPLRPLDGFTHE